MTDEKKSYRVTDRRHSSREPDAADATTVAESEAAPPPRPEVGRAEPPSGTGQPVSFTAFIMSLGAQASLLLGGVEGAEPDPKGAQWLISILEMLRDKTEGRRTAEETDALETILYQLRMAYVELTKSGRV
jgi:hypothetical protein